ncbi:Heterokaryon incompatibility 6-like protein [Cladobotryum mycophilum]|uniref:Heterokaryon incompatibility 6-like protein n=1 Tax=Cladobotryum mycophilum TaxID=491253 RepID=A0ABR0SA62_9HYPO
MSNFRIDDVFHAGPLGLLRVQDKNFEPAQTGQELSGYFSAEKIRLWASTKTVLTPPPTDNHKGLYRRMVDPYEIRVLELKPGSADEELRASLHHCSVEFDTSNKSVDGTIWRHATSAQNPEQPIWYTALSYTWGEPIFSGNVVCDGHNKAITASLEAFLKRFRSKDHSITLWIDQICINQDDNKEKEKQIPLMGRIYAHALSTIIWLGEAGTVSDAAIKLLEDATFRLSIGDAVFGPEDFERIYLPAAGSGIWAELWDLLSRPWFRRVWIVQELIVSRDVWVACGDSTMRWDLLSCACNNMVQAGVSSWLHDRFAGSRNTEWDDVCRWIEELAALKTRFETLNVFNNLLVLLVGNRDSKCFDLRDKIYGLLGMCSDLERRAVKVRYDDGYKASQLYHDVTTYLLTDDRESIQQMLYAVDHDSHDAPSWVPDWSQPRQTVSLGYKTSTRNVYTASGLTKSHLRLDPNRLDELHMRGIYFDTITETGDIFTNPDLSYVSPTTENRDLISCADFVANLGSYPSGCTIFDALWKTLVAGRDDTGYSECPPPSPKSSVSSSTNPLAAHPLYEDKPTHSARSAQGVGANSDSPA